MVSALAFFVFAIVVTVAAWRVVASPQVVRSALALLVVLGGMAPLFVMLAAEYVAVVQLLIYVGAVLILFLFGIMLTRSPVASDEHRLPVKRWLPAAVVAVAMLGLLVTAIRSSTGGQVLALDSVGRVEDVGAVLFSDYVVVFEAVSVLLLVVLIGSIAVARRD